MVGSAEASRAGTDDGAALTLASQEFRQRFAAFVGVGTIDTVAMSHLAAAGPLSTGELAARVGLAPSGATSLVDRLERADLAKRHGRPQNRRTVDVELTERGRQALELSSQWTRAALADTGGDQLAQLTRLLSALAAGLAIRSAQFEQLAGSRNPADKNPTST
jgi:DNA-binding MarR family transcriptional regulator